MQLNIVDAIHLKVCRLWRNLHVQVDESYLNYDDQILTYFGADCVDMADRLDTLARDQRWVLDGPLGGKVDTDRNTVVLELGQHMDRASFSEGTTVATLQEATRDLVATAEVSEDDDKRSDASYRLGQAVELVLDELTHNRGDVSMSRDRLIADMKHALIEGRHQ